ncbi:hypothetical protein ACROYT_G033150 [Oculina patagonica]
MEAFLVKSFPSLLIIVLMATSAVTEKLSVESKNGDSGRTLSTENNTTEGYNQDGTGIRRVLLSQHVFNDPNRQCYTQFFVGGQPPVDLRTGEKNLQYIRYICQPPTPNQQAQQTYYATMFDEHYGIAVFSAYTLTRARADFTHYPVLNAPSWCPTAGILRQGSRAIYHNQGDDYHTGHLVPARTYSKDQERHTSTYTYTNSVPQRPKFNTGQWSEFERRIRRYAEYTCSQWQPGQLPGTLYLLTGTSLARIQGLNPPQQNVNVQVNSLPPNNIAQGIAIPNSLWTAGCCVRPNVLNPKSFAVIGNNDQNVAQMFTQQVTVHWLQDFLAADVSHDNVGGPNVHLFPGNAACEDAINNVDLPPAQQGR